MKKMGLFLSCLIALSIATAYLPVEGQAQGAPVPAFPGAEGFGASTPGGRGGKVYFVETTADGIPAPSKSLREAVEAKDAEEDARIVVFRTSGTIELQSPLVITKPFITIAGQTAPGDGIALRLLGSSNDAALVIQTHDVVIRYLRIRPGPVGDVDAVWITDGAYNVMVDHCSLSWAVDESLSVYGTNDYTDDGRIMAIRDITVQWSILSETLHDSVHSEGLHSMGTMLGKGGGNISFHHNLLAHHNRRNPRVKTSGGTEGVVDFVNNVIYNFGEGAGEVTDTYGKVQLNYEGNFLKEGNDSRSSCAVSLKHEGVKGNFAVYVEGNTREPRNGGRVNPAICVAEPNDLVSSRHATPPISRSSADDAYNQVLAAAGATLPRRDPVDQRIVTETRTGTGSIIDEVSDSDWPILVATSPPADTDQDGMPDDWENYYGFNPLNPADGPQDADGDGYTNIEEYLNGTFPIPPTLPRVGEVVVSSDRATYHYEENLFASSYSISTATQDIKGMRLLISNTLREEDAQFYGAVIQESPGVFKAYLHNGYSRYPETQNIPGKGWIGGYPLGVGSPLHDGRTIENRWARWNVGESYVTVDSASKKIQVHWSVLFLYGYKVQPDQTVFSHVASRYGETDPSTQHGWHSRGVWAVLGEGTVVKNPSFEFNAPGSTAPPSYWSRSPGTPSNTRLELVTQFATEGTRSLRVETVPSHVNYYQGVWQDTKSPGPGKPLVFTCDLFVARGTVVINVYTFDPFPNVVWLGNAVVEANGGFERVDVPFRTLAGETYQRIHYRIDGIQPAGTSANTLFFVDHVTLEAK